MDRRLAAVLDEVDAAAASMVEDVAAMVRVPSVSGSDAENEAQQLFSDRMGGAGLEIDYWRIDLDELVGLADFPGMEVPRREAWGLVGRLAGNGDGPTLMLNGHIDV
ncbi:MAG TPA: hypothetical protein VE487_16990, partial [Ilumatobacter sp.]|nr:hypothetical protein [Ilumatobacter sp.]